MSVETKKRIFSDRPYTGDVSQYTYIQGNSSNQYVDSNGLILACTSFHIVSISFNTPVEVYGSYEPLSNI